MPSATSAARNSSIPCSASGTASRTTPCSSTESGVYHDKDKLHALNHKGKHFQVRGPLNIARTPQGRPVIAQAGGSEQGMELAARTAEMVFSLASNIEKNRAFYANVKGGWPATAAT